MRTFDFNGKVYRIVQDVQEELFVGCTKCAFYNDGILCAEVDGSGTGRELCSDTDCHYEEVA